MERTTFGMTFYIRRTKLDKTGKAPVFLRITMNGLRADTSIKYHISPQLWNTAKGRALENSREGKEVNRMLEAVGFNIMQVRRQLESEGVAVSVQSILSRYLGKNEEPQKLQKDHPHSDDERMVGKRSIPGEAYSYGTSRTGLFGEARISACSGEADRHPSHKTGA